VAKELSLRSINKKFTTEMKNFFAIMATASILSTSCAQEEPALEQGPSVNTPTTFSFRLEEETDVFDNAYSAYFDEEGKCRLIAEHGNIVSHVETDTVTMEEFHSPYLFVLFGVDAPDGCICPHRGATYHVHSFT
jgi:hypothetical protein